MTSDGALTLIDVERRTISTDREALAGFHVPFPVVLALSVHVPAERSESVRRFRRAHWY